MRKSIAEIKAELLESSGTRREELLAACAQDERKGVRNLVEFIRKKERALEREKHRLEEMKYFERKYAGGYQIICGVDEAGRGPLAGPVVAGACVLPLDAQILYLNDSKKVNPNRREALFDEIREKAVSYGVGIVSPERIDKINILQATYEAMAQAVLQLNVRPDLLLVDAVTIPQLSVTQMGIVRGDAKSVSIAAASILAKVTRDRLMVEYDRMYPEYGFAGHKGYGSAAHVDAIREFGPCPIHRRTFLKNI